MNPKITVLMPVYNGEKYLIEAINSILNQTYKNFEFLIINDASTDSTKSIILSYEDPRIRLIDLETNIGLVRSLNKGLELAKGDFIARMDSDDISMPERLEKQYNHIIKNPEIGLVASNWEIIDEQGRSIAIRNISYCYEEMFYLLFFKNILGHSTIFFNKELIKKLNGYNENYSTCEDHELWCRIIRTAKIEQVNDILVRWRKIPSSITSKFNNKQKLCSQRVFSNNVKMVLSDGLEEDKKYLPLQNYYFLKDVSNILPISLKLIELNEKIIDSACNNRHINLDKLINICYARFAVNIIILMKEGRLYDSILLLKILNKLEMIKSLAFLINKLISFCISALRTRRLFKSLRSLQHEIDI